MAIALVLLMACGKGKEAFKNDNKITVQDIALDNNKSEKPEDNRSADTVKATIANTFTQSSPSQKKQPVIDWDKKIIKTANISLELKNYAVYNTNIHQNIKNYGAYISGEEQSQTDGSIENNMTIKVPVDQFENLLQTFNGDGIKVIQKKITTEDVTGEVIDTKARMEAKKQVRNRYMDLLKQAKNMKEILEVQQEINTVQEQIESGSGRVGYLTHAAAYSTINLRYFQYSSGSNSTDLKPSYVTKLREAFKDGGGIILSLVLFVANIWPLLILGVIVWYFFKKMQSIKVKV